MVVRGGPRLFCSAVAAVLLTYKTVDVKMRSITGTLLSLVYGNLRISKNITERNNWFGSRLIMTAKISGSFIVTGSKPLSVWVPDFFPVKSLESVIYLTFITINRRRCSKY